MIKTNLTASAKLSVNHYWNSDFSHTPYMYQLFEDGQETDLSEMVESMLSSIDAEDGDEFEITITKTGKRPFGNRKMFLFQPHGYRRETIKECAKRERKVVSKKKRG